MFVVQYRWRLVPGTEEAFRTAWRAMTVAIRARHGTSGSRLHRTDDGELVAYAVWPSRQAWEAAAAQAPADPEAGAAMRACIAHSYGATPLEVVDDLLAP
ncbi:MAG TPA: antibiotic biosynthesis monooxygenase [Kofleriaceae bacterium]|nr:antibiotic biosynthesis monooxygenase [Kofleriaceae bacterium]